MEAEFSAKMGHIRRFFNLMFVNCVRETSAVSQHVCEACGQVIPLRKDIPGPSTKD